MSDTLVVNLYGGPGTGKSTCMAGVFCELKLRGVNCEMAPEYAKRKVWEGSKNILKDQLYIFGKQSHMIHDLAGQVDVIITDSPLLLSIHYGKNENESFKRSVIDTYNRYWNLNIFLVRQKEYNPAGRVQTEDEAKQMDGQIKDMLNQNDVKFLTLESGRETISEIATIVEVKLRARR